MNRIEAVYPYIDSLGTVAWMAIAPFFFLVCLSTSRIDWKLSWKHLLYFPVSLVFALEGISTTLGSEFWIYSLFQGYFLDIWMLLFFISSGIFAYLSIKVIRRNTTANKELEWFAFLFIGLLLSYAIIYLFVRNEYAVWFEYSMILLFELLIFALVFRLFRKAAHQQLFEISREDRKKSRNAEVLESLAQKLETTIHNQRPHLDAELNLNKLAQASGISTSELSLLFNAHYDSNFYDFIGQQRILYFEKIIEDPNYRKFKIEALATESGFKSKATFYKAFKRRHDVTPSQYLKQLRLREEV
ncbi:MAG: helix-turn-helix domain-containing protein [Crocinitomicaceae bacterium]